MVRLGALSLVVAFTACRAQAPLDNSDRAVKARVEQALQAELGMDAQKIAVDSSERHVTVSGTVRTYEEKTLVGRIVRRVPGVKGVTLNLIISE